MWRSEAGPSPLGACAFGPPTPPPSASNSSALPPPSAGLSSHPVYFPLSSKLVGLSGHARNRLRAGMWAARGSRGTKGAHGALGDEGEKKSVRYPSSCWFLLALILDPSANSSMLLYSFMSSMVAELSAGVCWRAVRVPAAAAAERCMELDLKWRRKRSGRRLRPPFIAAPPANREGCWAVTWRWARRAPCRAELGASEGRSGASCLGARGRQWERLREAKVAGAEGNNGGGTWESRGGTSIAALR